MLTQEPWGFTPDQIGRLTDWQIENLYAKPAQKRAEEFAKSLPKDAGGGGQSSPAAPARHSESVEESDLGEPGSKSHRNWHLSAYMNGPLGISPKQAVAMYERQLNTWRASQAASQSERS